MPFARSQGFVLPVKDKPMLPLLLMVADAPAASKAIDETIATMTLEEKAAQLGNAAPALPRADLPAYDYWSEGLHGFARDGIATVFPQAMALAATWDVDLLHRVGDVVSTEARAHYNAKAQKADRRRFGGLHIWSPNVNIFRDPRWGRGQETYGEDPYLTGRLGIAFVQGIQGPDPAHPKAIATPKHFAVHSGPEAGRNSFDVDVSPRDLAETYSPAFRATLTEGAALSTMCAYNSLNGTPACASSSLLNDRARGDWGFKGMIVSDCDAVGYIATFHHYRLDAKGAAAAALKAGTDLDCGPTYDALPAAVREGWCRKARWINRCGGCSPRARRWGSVSGSTARGRGSSPRRTTRRPIARWRSRPPKKRWCC
jgi:beta-glucosidase